MTTLIEAAKLALEALEEWEKSMSKGALEAHRILRTAIEAAKRQEPVAWLYWDSWGTMKLSQIMPPPVGAFPVYTTPPAAQPAQQEPVAWAVFEGRNAHDLYLPQEYDEALKMAGYKGDHAEVKPLYTTPPTAHRQPLTDDRIGQIIEQCKITLVNYCSDEKQIEFARAIEAAHGIKGEA
jgi:hypothetical protein